MIGKAILSWATELGLRGDQPKPSFCFTAKKKRVRPAFSAADYQTLRQTLIEEFKSPSSRSTDMRLLLLLYVEVLANSGIRVGEANNLRIRDVEKFTDDKGRPNYRLHVNLAHEI
jgi:integrase